jgi:hypothetical protein
LTQAFALEISKQAVHGTSAMQDAQKGLAVL